MMNFSKRRSIFINPGRVAVINTMIVVVIVFVLAACASPAVETQIVPEPEPNPEPVQAEAVLPEQEPENIPDCFRYLR